MFTVGNVPANKSKQQKIPRQGRFQRGHTLWKRAYSTPVNEDEAGTSTDTIDIQLNATDNRLDAHSTTEMSADEDSTHRQL